VTEVSLWNAAERRFDDVSHWFDLQTMRVGAAFHADAQAVATYQVKYQDEDRVYRRVEESVAAAMLAATVGTRRARPPAVPPPATLLSATDGQRDVSAILAEFAGPDGDFYQGSVRLCHLAPYGIRAVDAMSSSIEMNQFRDPQDLILLH
jgi:hypothetical protein